MCNSLRLSKVNPFSKSCSIPRTHPFEYVRVLLQSFFFMFLTLNSCFVGVSLLFLRARYRHIFQEFSGPNEGFIEKVYRLVQVWFIYSLPILKMLWYRNMNFSISFVDSRTCKRICDLTATETHTEVLPATVTKHF